MKRYAFLLCALLLLALPAGVYASAGPGPYNLLAAIDETSIRATADPHIFALRDARGRSGRIGTLTGNGDLSILPEYQNVCVNPNFYDGSDADTVPDSWTTASTVSGTVQYVSNENSAVRIAYTAVANDANDTIQLYSSNTISASADDDFILSANINGIVSGADAYLIIRAYNSGGTSIGFKYTNVKLTLATKRFFVEYADLPSGSVGVKAFLYIEKIDTGDSIDIRASSVNLNSAGVFRECTGNGESGCYWSGATNNSYSIHPPETMYVTGVEAARAVELWWTPDVASSAGEMFMLISDEHDALYLMVDGDDFSLGAELSSMVHFSYPFNAGEPLHVVTRWDNGVSLAVNGEIHTSGSGDYGDLLSTVYLGLDHYGVAQCNGEITAARFYRSLNDADVTWLYNGGAGRSVAEIEDMVEIVEGETGVFMVDPTVSYGQAGDILAGILSGGLVLFLIVLQVVAWFRQ